MGRFIVEQPIRHLFMYSLHYIFDKTKTKISGNMLLSLLLRN